MGKWFAGLKDSQTVHLWTHQLYGDKLHIGMCQMAQLNDRGKNSKNYVILVYVC